jgi:hypothetical protein
MASSVGIKISKPGVSAGTTSSLKDIDFHTDYPFLKIAKAEEGIEDVTVTGDEGMAEGSITITHSLGYVPRVIVLVSIEGGFYYNDIDAYQKAPFSLTSSGGMFGDNAGYTLDTTELEIFVGGYGWTDPARFGYGVYIFYEDRYSE